ncbi:MAG: hypothetical protein HQL69_23305 [Magnetococcales bacterium]|nr:hypothetical protein [Magnetococcales bacterium]
MSNEENLRRDLSLDNTLLSGLYEDPRFVPAAPLVSQPSTLDRLKMAISIRSSQSPFSNSSKVQSRDMEWENAYAGAQLVSAIGKMWFLTTLRYRLEPYEEATNIHYEEQRCKIAAFNAAVCLMDNLMPRKVDVNKASFEGQDYDTQLETSPRVMLRASAWLAHWLKQVPAVTTIYNPLPDRQLFHHISSLFALEMGWIHFIYHYYNPKNTSVTEYPADEDIQKMLSKNIAERDHFDNATIVAWAVSKLPYTDKHNGKYWLEWLLDCISVDKIELLYQQMALETDPPSLDLNGAPVHIWPDYGLEQNDSAKSG